MHPPASADVLLRGERDAVFSHRARRARGDSDVAIRELEQASETRADAVTHEGWQVFSWLRCRVLLAEMYRDAGRHADAEHVALEVRHLLSVADDDNPLVARALKVSQSD